MESPFVAIQENFKQLESKLQDLQQQVKSLKGKKGEASSKVADKDKPVLLFLAAAGGNYVTASWPGIQQVLDDYYLQVKEDRIHSYSKNPAIYCNHPRPCLLLIPSESWATVSMNQVEVYHDPFWVPAPGAQVLRNVVTCN